MSQPSHASHADSALAERRAAMVSLIVGILLMVLKFVAFVRTGSSAVFSDALESIVNVLASGFTLYSVILAHAPADQEHPYGHGKIEFLAAGFEGGMILLAALVVAGRAIERLVHLGPLEQIGTGIILLAIATLVNGFVGFYLLARGKRHGSIALEADGRHLLSDAATSGAVIVALVMVQFTNLLWLDPVAALVAAVYLVWLAWGLIRRSAAGLMDEQDVSDNLKIREILDSHIGPAAKQPPICSYHKLRHRHSGRYHWIDFHIMVEPTLTIDEGHRIASAIEYEIELALGEGNATAHVEPCEAPECRH